ncbi:hypothetical protein AVEN_148975-1 [Araneus ventricosus]|uniref:Uncharacterized protein n=1 Tax=Araneus ventricosus TaxID=182803 RepID=A0A4Y2J0T3_ARAVE|nr:hypothetical protein AVEN_148975-1 [Araneus ventricosus]
MPRCPKQLSAKSTATVFFPDRVGLQQAKTKYEMYIAMNKFYSRSVNSFSICSSSQSKVYDLGFYLIVRNDCSSLIGQVLELLEVIGFHAQTFAIFPDSFAFCSVLSLRDK